MHRAAARWLKLPAASRATQKARQHCLAAANGAPAHETLAIGVVGDQSLIPFELHPANITIMVVADQSHPVPPVALHAPDYALASIFDGHTSGPTTERVGAGIDRIGQHVVERRINRKTPDDSFGGTSYTQIRQQDLLLPAPHQHLSDRLQFRELAKHQGDGFLNAAVGVLFDAIAASLHVTDRHGRKEFASSRLLLDRSIERCRKTDSSISLIVPFMPSRRRSLGDAAS